MTQNKNSNTIFWIIGILALLWNIIGVAQYLIQVYMTEELIQTLPKADQEWFNNVPAWATAAFAIAVFAGLFACIGLLFKKSWSVALFTLSFIAVLVQQVYNFFIQDFVELSGARLFMPIVILLISGFLMWYSKGLKIKNFLK